HRESVLAQDRREVLRRLELLEAELAEAEHRVIPFLDVLLHRVDLEADVLLVLERLGSGRTRGDRAGVGRVRRRLTPPSGHRGARRDTEHDEQISKWHTCLLCSRACGAWARWAPGGGLGGPIGPSRQPHGPSVPHAYCCADGFTGFSVVGYL